MTPAALAACAAVGVLLVSGCLGNSPDHGSGTALSTPSIAPSSTGPDPSPAATTAAASATHRPTLTPAPGNTTATHPAPNPDPGPTDDAAAPPPDTEAGEPAYSPGWPPLDHAFIRPGGVLAFTIDGTNATCTSGFVFQSPDNRTLYVGTAAHCLAAPSPSSITSLAEPECAPASVALGFPVRIQGAVEPGRLAYSSWHTMQGVHETDANACAGNDFALIRVADADRRWVHPAMLNHGGPTALANGSSIAPRERVVSVGLASYHAGEDAATTHEGYVVEQTNGGWQTTAHLSAPLLDEDAGSPAVDGSGRAIGILAEPQVQVTPGAAGFTNLDKALAYAQRHAGIQVKLATSEVLGEGRLPDLP